jgi:cytochrome P450
VLQANKRLFGNGLLTSEGDFWLRQRRLAQPAFHRTRIASYGETMVRYTEQMLEHWSHGQEVDAHQEMMQLTLNIVGKTLFDADVAGDAREIGKTITMLLDFSSDFRRLIFTPKWLPTPRNIQTNLAIRRLNKIVFRMIAERRASGGDAGDLLSMLLAARDEDGSRMDDKQLRDETLTLFLAGYETTANLLAWTWWLLATHPEVERKLHQELDGLLAGRPPAMDDLPRLRYAGHVLTESLRLYPPAWGMARLAIEDHEIAGYPVPAGTGVAIAQWVVQRDPRWYEAPDEFRPERWEGDLQKRLPRFAYFPFGGGPRQCIGNMFALMEATLVLATVAQHFRLRMMSNQEIVPLASITLRPKNAVAMRLESRRGAKADVNVPAAVNRI